MISAVIITLNEAHNIQRCLESLEGIVEEIIVVDAFSTDQTADICRAFGVRFFQNEWQGYARAKNFGNAQAKGSYVLSIDADEVLSPALRKSISAVKSNLSGVYKWNRLTNYCGQWVRHGGWYPDAKVRLFPRDLTRWEGDYVHEQLKLPQGVKVQHLSGDLLHYSFSSSEEHLARIQRYALLAAQKLYAQGKESRWHHLVFQPFIRFIRTYIIKGGWKNGRLGWLLSRRAAYATYLRYKILHQIGKDEKA